MKQLKKYRFGLVGIFLLLIAYLAVRLPQLTALPIFTDEAIYIRWAQIALNDPAWRFISLTDGKQPLAIWVMMIMMKFIDDPLFAARFASVLTGMATMFGIGFLSYLLFKRWVVGFLAALLYIVYLFAQVHDRLALQDSMVNVFVIWSLCFAILLVRHVRLDIAYTLGFFLGAGMLTKTNTAFSIALLPLTLLLFNFKQKKWKKQLVTWIGYAVIAVVISQVMYSLLRLSPFFGIIAEKNYTFVYPISEWLQHPFTYFVGNFQGLFSWLLQYLTPAYIILIVISLVLIKQFWREKLLLLLYFLVPFLYLAFFGRVIYPRFILFMSLMLLPLAAWSLDVLLTRVSKHKYALVAKVALVLLVIGYPLYVSLQVITHPLTAPIATADRNQYVTGWSAGWGVPETVAFLEKQAENGPIFVATQGTFGLMPYALEIYLKDNTNITIKGYWPIQDAIPAELLEKAKEMPVYLIFYQPCPSCDASYAPPPSWPVQEVLQPQRGNEPAALTVYTLK